MMTETNIIPFKKPEILNTFREPVLQETAVPKPIKSEKKKPVIIEVMPWETMPAGYTDYRPLLQRDGLILFSWEIHGGKIKIVWITSNRGMYKYQAWIDDENDLHSTLPCKKYEDWRSRWYSGKDPDFIIYASPPSLTASARGVFIVKLRASGVSVNFDYEFSLGRQKAAREAAVYDRIENRQNYLSNEEAELLEAYRQFDNNSKQAFMEHMKALLSEQEKEGKK
jgi:hypothetical protein